MFRGGFTGTRDTRDTHTHTHTHTQSTNDGKNERRERKEKTNKSYRLAFGYRIRPIDRYLSTRDVLRTAYVLESHRGAIDIGVVAHVATAVSVYEGLPEFTARPNEFLFQGNGVQTRRGN